MITAVADRLTVRKRLNEGTLVAAPLQDCVAREQQGIHELPSPEVIL